jgi:rod shape determining protein RodA
MNNNSKLSSTTIMLMVGVVSLLLISSIILRSLSPGLFPLYFFYIVFALLVFVILSGVDFNIYTLFSKYFYIISIILLLLPLIIGEVTRGTIRWIPLGPINLQPSEIARPLLLLYFAKYLTEDKVDFKRLLKSLLLLVVPFFLILIQPSLGVALLLAAGYFGALLASNINKKLVFAVLGIVFLLSPIFWLTLADYQKQRLASFIDPASDPFGTGYHSIQSMISVGSGKLFGRGLGEGVQTQLAFLPEKHTDFVFAATAEELGFAGAMLILVGLFIIYYSLIIISENSLNPTARSYVTAIFFVLFTETVIHIGMNMSILPVTGVPLPFVSYGGSALIGTSIAIGIAAAARKQ